jgi:hypothetical protein
MTIDEQRQEFDQWWAAAGSNIFAPADRDKVEAACATFHNKGFMVGISAAKPASESNVHKPVSPPPDTGETLLNRD